MSPHNVEPVSPDVFIEQTHEEITEILRQHDPESPWATKFKNFIELKEAVAFRYGFYFGAIMSALAVVVILLVTRT